MPADLDINNLKVYSNKDVVSVYDDEKLQAPEIRIFSNHKNDILNKRVLDIGVGTGRTTPHIKRLAEEYVGVDYSQVMVEKCQVKFGKQGFYQVDVRDMGRFEDNSFDFVLFSYNGIDYINHADRLKGLREINRVLDKNGYFVFSAHNRNSIKYTPLPRFRYSLNLKMQQYYFLTYIVQWFNYLKTRKYTEYNDTYALINDGSHDFQLIHYYIDIQNQLAQLRAEGFDPVSMYDLSGNKIDLDNTESDSPWIYYVSRKNIS